MSVQRACDVCHFYRQRSDGSSGVSRYSLRTVTGVRRTVGSIDLCWQCWERIAAPRVSPSKQAGAKRMWERRRAA